MKPLILTVLVTAGLVIAAPQAFAKDLATWSEGANKEFKAEKCITIPGTPSVPGICSPDAKIPYPCPKWNNPGRMCEQTVKGACSPSVPGIPESKQCASANIGTVSVQADGALATTGSSVQVNNTVYSGLLGWQTHFTISCEVKTDAKFKACVDLLHPTSVEVSTDSVSCVIGDGLSYNGSPIAANICLFVEATNVSSGNPTGSVGAQVNAQIGFGKQSIAGQEIDLGNESWTETLFRIGY